MTKVNICGLRSAEDALLMNRLQPDYAGVILSAGFRRTVAYETARKIRETLDPAIPLVGVFVDEEEERMASFLKEGIIDIAQLHGQESDETGRSLIKRTGKPVWKAFQVGKEADLGRIIACPADLLLLDAGQGSGQTFDWSLAAGVKRPFLLAGGLTPENVRLAITQILPYGVDVSSGDETDGRKDPKKAEAFVRKVRFSSEETQEH